MEVELKRIRKCDLSCPLKCRNQGSYPLQCLTPWQGTRPLQAVGTSSGPEKDHDCGRGNGGGGCSETGQAGHFGDRVGGGRVREGRRTSGKRLGSVLGAGWLRHFSRRGAREEGTLGGQAPAWRKLEEVTDPRAGSAEPD